MVNINTIVSTVKKDGPVPTTNDDLSDICHKIIHENFRISAKDLQNLCSSEQERQKISAMGTVRFAWHRVNCCNNIPVCKVCGKENKWLSVKRRYSFTCSRACSNIDITRLEKIQETLKERYGVNNASQIVEVKQKKRETTQKNYGVDYPAQNTQLRKKQLNTMRDRFGVEYPLQSEKIKSKAQKTLQEKHGVLNAAWSKELQDKKKKTCLAKYGTEYPYSSECVRDKILTTMRENWGVENPSQHPDIQKRRTDTFQERYGVKSAAYIGRDQKTVEILSDKEKFIEFITDKTIKESAELLEVSLNTIFLKTKIYACGDLFRHDVDSSSSYEKIITEMLTMYGITYDLHNRKIIHPYELDIFIPEHNLAIEVGSAYWHGEKNGKLENYHSEKWKRCRALGITLLQFFDDDIFTFWHLTESKILRCLKLSSVPVIGARKITIGKPSRQEEQRFLTEWHTKGWAAVRSDSVGGYYNGKLIAIMTIKKSSNANRISIDRWATNINYSFPGLFSRLLSSWIKKENFKGTIETWCDNRLGTGKVYQSAGFFEKECSSPGYWYFKNSGLENRIRYQRHKLKSLFDLSDYENRRELTEYDIMLSQGYDRLWDAGHTKWTKEII